ncbi:MAG TPA: 50S ribosomal protein L18 [Acidimicrobiales bacterium]|jgi:large subunit ribosomal protein L18|nr:50S ribosomal protein L18 [Acidimicrobiales bacterium]
MPRTTRELRLRRHRRVRKTLSGTPERPRVAMSRSNKHISAQIIDDVNGRTLAAASSVEPAFKDVSGGNVEGAKKVAELLASRAKEANIATVVFDRGGFDYHGRVAAFADALRAGGLEF